MRVAIAVLMALLVQCEAVAQSPIESYRLEGTWSRDCANRREKRLAIDLVASTAILHRGQDAVLRFAIRTGSPVAEGKVQLVLILTDVFAAGAWRAKYEAEPPVGEFPATFEKADKHLVIGPRDLEIRTDIPTGRVEKCLN
jgi:hypothetical protein